MSEYSRPVDYSSISRIYDISRAANAETIEKLVKVLHVDGNSMLLDMGCGTGNYTFTLQQAAKSVIGIDISAAMLGKAQVKFPALQLIRGDITRLPFSSNTFDGALAIQVLHHVKKKGIFLVEARRVLRNGAFIAVHSCSHRQMRAFWFYHYFPKGLEVDQARIPDAGEIAYLLDGAGFSNIGSEICYHDVVVKDETPENYLDKNYRDGVSTFAFLAEDDIEQGCRKIREEIASGAAKGIIQKAEAEVAERIGGSTIVYGQKTG
jgi:ubiquinone/menaquinone biosynthesis C-methylase UbiE